MAGSKSYMQSVLTTAVAADALAVWFLGQNGFLIKTANNTRIAIDPYLTDSCAHRFPDLPFDLSRKVPIFLEPEDLDVDVVLITHSHVDHLDEETLTRLRCKPKFVAPWEAYQKLLSLGISQEACILVHPHQRIHLHDVHIEGTFALPTDHTDINHIGLLIEADNGIRFYNTGDTAYAEALHRLLPTKIDICAICINGLFHNLSHQDAAQMIKTISPSIVIPTHYDMMACNQADPEMFHNALLHAHSKAQYIRMNYSDPLIYKAVRS